MERGTHRHTPIAYHGRHAGGDRKSTVCHNARSQAANRDRRSAVGSRVRCAGATACFKNAQRTIVDDKEASEERFRCIIKVLRA